MLMLIVGPLDPCTILCAVDGERVLVGNNEDYFYNEDYYIKIVPGDGGRYGRAVFYTKFWWLGEVAQGGFNEKGLFFDVAAGPRDGKTSREMDGRLLPLWFSNEELLARCSSVEEAIHYLEQFNMNGGMPGHYLLADASGRSVIFEVTNGHDQVVEKKGRIQIATNYLVTAPGLAGSGGEDREKTVASVLSGRSQIMPRDLARALRLSAQSWSDGGTLYSNIVDLKKRTMILFERNKLDRVLTLDLADQLTRGGFRKTIPALFQEPPPPGVRVSQGLPADRS